MCVLRGVKQCLYIFLVVMGLNRGLNWGLFQVAVLFCIFSVAGNKAVDAVAKAGVSLLKSNAEIPYTDFKHLIWNHVKNCWPVAWSPDSNNKLFKIQTRNQIVYFQPSAK